MGLWDSVKSAFSGGSSSSKDDDDDDKSSFSSSSSYTKTQDYSGKRPRSRGETDEEYDAKKVTSPKERSASSGKDDKSGHVSGPTSWDVEEIGVTTNKFGVPQYDYSERSASSSKDDKDKDGYSDFYTENPSSTISPEQYKAQSLASKIAVLANPAIGLTGLTLAKLQKNGILPNIADLGNSGASTAGPADAAVNSILKDKSKTEDQKQQEIKDVITEAVEEEESKKRAQVGIGMVDELTANAYNPKGKNDPGDIFRDPEAFLSGNGLLLADQGFALKAKAKGTMLDDPEEMNEGGLNYDPATASIGKNGKVGAVEAQETQGYEAVDVTQDVENAAAKTIEGELSDGATMDAEQIDIEATANGENAVGEALNDYATQGMSTIIDTSTAAGKRLAAELGEGNYVDSKATMQGQLQILSEQFVGPDGEPTIPSWAAATARNVSRIAAFNGMTGTAATAAMSQALMEASLPMAQQDATFFQTLTTKNLDNKQQATINKASVLANMEIANLDARTQAAVANSQAFLALDLANLTNAQQTEIVNTQSRVQAILETAKEKNAARLFTAKEENSAAQFYDQLGAQIEQFNAGQVNAMKQFNVGEINDASQFNAEMENNREEFYKEMQYNVDVANARWRQTVETENTKLAFEAAKSDVSSMLKLGSEALARMWDREDSILDYTWKSSDNELERAVDMYKADRIFALDKQRLENEVDMATGAGWFETLKWLGGDDPIETALDLLF